MRRSLATRIRLLVVACAVAWCRPASGALRMAPLDSIEWVVFDTDVIVRGTVVEAVHSTGPEFNYASVKVRVIETIKGPAADAVTFYVENDLVKFWPAGEQLFFLINTPRYTRGRVPTTQQAAVFAAHPLTLRNAWARYPIPLSANPPAQVYDAELRVLEGRAAILDAVRREARQPPKVQYGVLEIHVSAKSEFFALAPQRRADYMNLLVDERAAARARRWVKSADPWDRWNGASVLKHFPSAENAALLTPWLADPFKEDGNWPGMEDWGWSGGEGKWRQTAGYPMRRVAYDALRGWGQAPADAVLAEMAYPARRLGRWTPAVALGGLGALVLFLVAFGWVGRRRWWTGLTGASMLLFLMVVGLWVRSVWRIDEVGWSDRAGFRYEVSTIEGGVRVMRIEKWTDPAPLGLISMPREAAAEADWRPSNRWWAPPGGPATHVGRMGFATDTGTMGGPMMTAYAYRAWTLPLWAPCAALSLLPAMRVGWWHMRKRRHGAGQCPGCGYDLRASPERCPECGRARV